MRQQKAHFVMRERIFKRIVQLIPEFLRRRRREASGFEFVPCGWRCTAQGTNTASQHTEKMQTSRDCPAAQVTASGTSPVMTGKLRSGTADLMRNLDNGFSRDATFRFGKFRRVFGIELF